MSHLTRVMIMSLSILFFLLPLLFLPFSSCSVDTGTRGEVALCFLTNDFNIVF